MKNTLLFSLLILTFSCTKGKADKSIQPDNSKEQKTPIEENYSLPLDAETPLWNYYSQHAEIDGKPKLIWFNPNRYSIDYFDIQSQTLERKVKIDINGPNAVPGMGLNSSIKFINEDTVVLYSGPLRQIFLTDISGEVYKKIDLSDYPSGFGSIALNTSIAYRKGSVYMQVLPIIPIDIPENFNPKYNKIAKIDLSDGSVKEFEIDYPAVYSDKNIPQQLKMMSIIYNKKIDKFIINYPLSDDLYVTDFESGVERYPASSELVGEVIPIDRRNSEIEPSRIQNSYYWMNDSYEGLIFDEENELYLRTVRKGITLEQLNNRDFVTDTQILIFNKEFEQVGQINERGPTFDYSFFFDKKFYWNKDIQKYNLEAGNEDEIFFQSRDLTF
ncbi:DUF4221 family protein [Algoriphagus formosus]|uniref:DUF4221 family protein n=1 Tax=Algoriphagus formosus TaxID=2007308 RepID=UPI000C290EA3|nr:DUF4221 family protein [Algoriphagus formosus]